MIFILRRRKNIPALKGKTQDTNTEDPNREGTPTLGKKSETITPTKHLLYSEDKHLMEQQQQHPPKKRVRGRLLHSHCWRQALPCATRRATPTDVSRHESLLPPVTPPTQQCRLRRDTPCRRTTPSHLSRRHLCTTTLVVCYRRTPTM